MMKPAYRSLAFGVAALSVAACAQKIETITPEIETQLISSLQSGQVELDCQTSCAVTWETNRGALRQYHDAQNWRILALNTMQIGYQNDLAYFYLGRAAEGLGSLEAALRYYKISGALSTGTNTRAKCAGLLNTCSRFTLPGDTQGRIQIVSAALQKQSSSWVTPAPTSSGGWVNPPPVRR